MSWLDDKTDTEKLLDICIAITTYINLDSAGMLQPPTSLIDKMSAMQLEQDISRIKKKKILLDIDNIISTLVKIK